MVADNAAVPGGEDSTAQVIDVDVTCVSCGYNLRGLTDERTCPECGLPVQASRVGIMVIYGNARWIGRLSRGVKMLPISVVTAVIAVTMFTGVINAPPDPDSQVKPIALMICVSMFIAAHVTVGCCLVMITQRQPFPVLLQVGSWQRLVIRVAGYLAVAFGAIAEVLVLRDLDDELTIGLLVIIGLSMPVMWMFALYYLQSLAPLVPDHALVKVLRLVQWLALACILMPPVVGIVFAFLSAGESAEGMLALWLPLVLVTLLVGVGAMLTYLDALRAAAERAEQYHDDSPSTS